MGHRKRKVPGSNGRTHSEWVVKYRRIGMTVCHRFRRQSLLHLVEFRTEAQSASPDLANRFLEGLPHFQSEGASDGFGGIEYPLACCFEIFSPFAEAERRPTSLGGPRFCNVLWYGLYGGNLYLSDEAAVCWISRLSTAMPRTHLTEIRSIAMARSTYNLSDDFRTNFVHKPAARPYAEISLCFELSSFSRPIRRHRLG